MTREQLFRFFFLAVFLFLLYQILHILSPFYTGILGAIVVALIFFPLYRLILKRIGFHRVNLAAASSTLLVIIILVIPLVFLSWLLFHELSAIHPLIEQISAKITSWRQGEPFVEIKWLAFLQMKVQSILDLIQLDLPQFARESADNILNLIKGSGKRLPQNIFIIVINILVMIFSLFFFFRDGPMLVKKIKDLIPMDEKHKDHIAQQLYLTVTAVVRGVFIVAFAQGTIAGIGFFILDVPSPTLLGFLTMFTALIPFVGATLVWLPISIYYFTQGIVGKGVLLFLWGALVVSLVDNFLRPIVIGSRAKLPILFLFFGLLGGIKIYGAMGLFLGPLVVALLIAFARIYREEFRPGSKGDKEI